VLTIDSSSEGKAVTLKILSETYWSARAVSTKILYGNYHKTYTNLEELSKARQVIQNKVTYLLKRIKMLDMLMTMFWHNIL
jgi:hypothetical protein